jgi:hypothetical protein
MKRPDEMTVDQTTVDVTTVAIVFNSEGFY